MLAFPVRARPKVGMISDQPLWTKSFSIETDLEIVQPAGSYNNNFTVGSLAAAEDAPGTVEIISPTAAARKLHPPADFPRFSQLLLPVLEIPEVDCTVRTYVPEGSAVTRALVDVKLPLAVGLGGSKASTLRKLFAEASSARCRRRQRERTRPKGSPVELPPEVMRVIFGKLSCKETVGSARSVNSTWRDAADAVLPPGSYRRSLYEFIHGKRARASASVGPSGGGGRERSTIDRDMWATCSWFKKERFRECSGKEVMELLEGGLRWLEAKVAHLEELEFCLAALSGDGGDGDDVDEIDVDANANTDAIQLQRLRPFLTAVKFFCEERGVSCGSAAATPKKSVSPPPNLPFGLRLGKTAAAAAATAAAAAASEAASGPPPTTSDDTRWDGWLVFTAAIALAFSEDRPFLCRCALESVWGTSGLPRTQIIELLSRMFFALQPAPPARVNSQGTTPTGFQAASSVSTVVRWNATGSNRLRSDLLVCVCALESYFVRFPRPQVDDDGDDAVWSQSTTGGSQTASTNPQQQQQQQAVDESMLTAEQREVVNAVLDVGQTLKVVAYAGTGKTVTLRAFAMRNPHLRTVYLAFNRSVAMGAGLTFPKHVECRTMNSLSMRGKNFGYFGDKDGNAFKTNIKADVVSFLRRRDRSVS